MLETLKRWMVLAQDAAYISYMDTKLKLRDSFKYALVTIGVPLYNEERFLPDCIESIKRQSYRNWECIIVNDCSTDNSVRVAENLIAGDSRFKMVHHDVNRGLAASRNSALRNAKGEYITFLDSDDFLFSSSIWQRVHALIEDTSDEVAGSFFKLVSCHEDTKYSNFIPARYFRNRGKTVNYINSKGECPFNAHAPLLKTSIVRSFSGFKEDMRHGAEDWDLWSRMLRHGYVFIPCYGYGGVYRRKRSSMVRRLSVYHANEAKRIIDRAYLPMHGKPEVKNAPFVFRESLCYYQKALLEAERLIGYSMLNFLSNDDDGTRAILNQLDPSISYLMRSYIPLYKIMDSFIMRYFCLDYRTYDGKLEKYMEIKRKFKSKLIYHLKKESSIYEDVEI